MASINNLTGREIYDLVRSDLQKVEEEFCSQSVSSVQPISEIAEYLQGSGGKRLRPALVLLASKMCGYQGYPVIRLSAVVELIHTATLVHDDIIDGAETRRGRPSANHRWGNHMSVLAGDWLYMQAFNVALAERNFKILDLLIGVTQVMVEGELLQLTHLHKTDVTEDDYLELADRKTAMLFSTCLRLGAVLAGRSEEEEMKLGSYGTNLGMAFQLIDDILDFTSSEEVLGKPVGSDLREGKITLPLIFLLKRCAPAEAAKISRVLSEGSYQSVPLSEIMDLFERHGSLNAAREKARHFADTAKSCLDIFPESQYKDALRSLADYIVERES
ncbi:MAG: polyprenyl synthetase family protein [Deltaproteobacteria bacterium]